MMGLSKGISLEHSVCVLVIPVGLVRWSYENDGSTELRTSFLRRPFQSAAGRVSLHGVGPHHVAK